MPGTYVCTGISLKTREAEYQAVLPVAVYNCHNAYVKSDEWAKDLGVDKV